MADTTDDRSAALERLRELGAAGAIVAPAPEADLERSGNEVEAGGRTARLLIRPVHLSYVKDGVRHYPAATTGDVVLLSAAQAERLDALGATVDPDASPAEVAEVLGGDVSDDDLATMGAADLVAYVGQNPDARDRVRELEVARPKDKQRKTVLDATTVEAE